MKIPSDIQDRILALFGDPILPILLILVIAVVLTRLARRGVHGLVKTLMDRETSEGTAQELSAVEVGKRMDTLDALGIRVIRMFVVLIALVMILGELNLDIGPALAGLGVVGIAVGFGAQSLVRDYFNGALILIENQFSVGDVVTIADVSGVVEDLSLRRTTLRDLSGVVHTVPNGEIRVASNSTRTWARVNENVQVAYDTDFDHAIEVVNGVGRSLYEDPEWRRRVLEPLTVLRINALEDSGVSLKVTGSVRASDQWAVAGEFRRRLLAAFAAEGIEIPFPHRVVISRSAASVPLEAVAAEPGDAEASGDADPDPA
jgi:moderate conductance mechanosensitive channel